MTGKRAIPILACVIVLALSGCYEDISTVRYEPGVYKGQYDPLLPKLLNGDLHEQLEERARIAGMDR